MGLELTGASPAYVSGFTGGSSNQKSGYTFTVVGGTNMYQAVANPTVDGTTGNRSFCVDHTGVIRTQDADYTASAAACAGTIIE